MFLPSPGTLVADKYQLEALLGQGGMGAVYRARHVLMDATVALKWLRPELGSSAEARERLVREARAVARIKHPNVVQVYDVDSYQGSLFMVMELLEGETFSDLIAKEKLTTQRVIQLLMGAMQGLAAAHDRGVIHRDIKPENIFVVRNAQYPEGIAKLLDFGISKMDARVSTSPRLTQTGHSIGTPLYMSVEALTRNDDVDARADIYSFGVVLYHALSGTLPFDGETFAGVVLSIGTTRPKRLRQLRPELPAELDRIVMKAIARNRDDRYRTVHDLLEALRAVEAPLGLLPSPIAQTAAHTPGPPPDAGTLADADSSLDDLQRLQRAGSRRHKLLALTLLLGLALAGLAYASSSGPRALPSAHPVGVSRPPALPQPELAPSSLPIPDVAELPPTAPAHVDAAARVRPPEPARASGRTTQRAARAEPRVRAEAADKPPASSKAERPESTVEPASEPPARPATGGKSGALLREDF